MPTRDKTGGWGVQLTKRRRGNKPWRKEALEQPGEEKQKEKGKKRDRTERVEQRRNPKGQNRKQPGEQSI